MTSVFYYLMRLLLNVTSSQDSSVRLPSEVYLQDSSIFAESELTGMRALYISYNSRFDFTPDARVNSPVAGAMDMDLITILNGGKLFQQTSSPAKLVMNLTRQLTINAGAVMDVSHLHLNAHNVFIDVSGVLTARSRGYLPGEGPEPGVPSSSSASGAGHGGAGGHGAGQPRVGQAYDSFDAPVDFGSGGGQGYQNLVSGISGILGAGYRIREYRVRESVTRLAEQLAEQTQNDWHWKLCES